MPSTTEVPRAPRWRVVALLDYDTFDAYREFPFRARFLLRTFGVRMDHCHLRRHRTKRGYHIVVHLLCLRRPPPVFIVAVQTILGSDWKRETFNLFRTLTLSAAPKPWQEMGRWNTLYAKKFDVPVAGAENEERPSSALTD